MTIYIYPGLSKMMRQIAKPAPFVEPAAMDLYKNIMKDIDKLGGRKITLDYILLENPKQFGWRERELKSRINSRINVNESRGYTRKVWRTEEILIIINNPHLESQELIKLLNRSVYSIRGMRSKLRRKD